MQAVSGHASDAHIARLCKSDIDTLLVLLQVAMLHKVAAWHFFMQSTCALCNLSQRPSRQVLTDSAQA